MKQKKRKAACELKRPGVLPASLLIWLLLPAVSMGAELKGEVELTEAGTVVGFDRLPLYSSVSVVLYPLDGQKMESRSPVTHEIRVKENSLDPVFITIARGDAVKFINQSELLHHIKGIAADQNSIEAVLDRKGDEKSLVTLRFSETGSWYLYCDMHNAKFGQIDVVDSSYIYNLRQAGQFYFAGLEPGKWRVQARTVANSRGDIEAEAFSSPPLIRISLPLETDNSGEQQE